MQFLADAPQRVHLVNQTTGEDMEVLFNPTQLGLQTNVNYARQTPPGLDHQVLQYQNTGNRTTQDLEFYLDAFQAADAPGAPDITDFERFMSALTIPPGGTQGVADTRPPRVLMIWPGVLTIEAVVTTLTFRWTVFALEGGALIYTAACTLEEILDQRRTSDQLRKGA